MVSRYKLEQLMASEEFPGPVLSTGYIRDEGLALRMKNPEVDYDLELDIAQNFTKFLEYLTEGSYRIELTEFTGSDDIVVNLKKSRGKVKSPFTIIPRDDEGRILIFDEYHGNVKKDLTFRDVLDKYSRYVADNYKENK